MKSTSASNRQPVTTKPLYLFEDYSTKQGETALSVQIDIRDLAKLYAEHESQSGQYESNWSCNGKAQYIPQTIHNADEALNALEGFQFPADIKRDAQRASRQLTDAFEQVSKLQTVHNLTSGKLDRRKFNAIARHTSAGTFDNDTVRPYRRTQPTPGTLPTIAIVVSAGWQEMWRDPHYIPRVLTLTLGIVWACQAVGLPVYAALCQGHCDLNTSKYAQAVKANMLLTPDSTISPKAYGIALHSDLWRYGSITSLAADPQANQVFTRIRSRKLRNSKLQYFSALNGGHAVNWARKNLNADLVISIGRNQDRRDADIQLDGDFTLDQAVKAISQQAKSL